MGSWELLLEIVLLLTACMLAGSLMAWMRQSPLVGYLLAGMLMGGPGSFALIRAEEHIESIAELGVALLLFSLGLEFSLQRVLELGTKTLLSGVAQVLVTWAAGVAGAWCLGLPPVAAVAVGAMLSLSSTATVLRVLIERGEMDSLCGRNSLAVLLVQDMAVVPLAILIPLLSTASDPIVVALRVGGILVLAVGVVGLLYLVLNYAVVTALKTRSFTRNRELAVLLSIIVGLGATWLAHAAGLSPALGAFMAGMFLGSSPFALQVRADVASLRIVLLTLFFGAVGMVADPVWMFRHLPQVLLIAAGIMSAKALIIWILFRVMGSPSGISLATGMCLCQVGEFAFVLGSDAKGSGVLGDTAYSAIVSASIVTLFATPWLIGMAPRVAQWMPGRRLRSSTTQSDVPSEAPHYDVVVVGFGPAGQGAVSGLVGRKQRVLILDLSPQGVEVARLFGFEGMTADATNAEVLEHVHLPHTRTVVITLPSRHDALTVLKIVRGLAPAATIIVRSRYQAYHHEFIEAGADHVANDEHQIGQVLAGFVDSTLQNETLQ